MTNAELYDRVIQVVSEASANLLPHFGNATALFHKGYHSASAVTQLDIDTEAFLMRELSALDPSITFFGEESQGVRSERYWLVDPIDGTGHFMRGIPRACVMVSLIEHGEATIAVIGNIGTGEIFAARKGAGATKNGAPIAVSSRGLSDAYIVFESNPAPDKNMELYRTLSRKTVLLRHIVSGYDFSLIAEGKMEGRICVDPYGEDWDYAPGTLLVREAGGTVANIGARSYDFTNHNFLAVNPVVFRELTEGADALLPLT